MLQAPGTGSSSLKTAANRARKTCASLFTTPLGVTLNKVWRKHTVSCIVFPLVILVIATVVATYHLRASRPPVEAGELIGTSSLINALIVAAYNSIMKQRDTVQYGVLLSRLPKIKLIYASAALIQVASIILIPTSLVLLILRHHVIASILCLINYIFSILLVLLSYVVNNTEKIKSYYEAYYDDLFQESHDTQNDRWIELCSGFFTTLLFRPFQEVRKDAYFLFTHIKKQLLKIELNEQESPNPDLKQIYLLLKKMHQICDTNNTALFWRLCYYGFHELKEKDEESTMKVAVLMDVFLCQLSTMFPLSDDRKCLAAYLGKSNKTFNRMSSNWAKAYGIEIINTVLMRNPFFSFENVDNSIPSSIRNAVNLARDTSLAVFEGDDEHVG